MDYEIRKILTPDQRASIISRLDEFEYTYYHQNYNLHDVKYWHVNEKTFPEIRSIRKEFPELKVHAQYFLEYGVGSFTRKHTDNDKKIDLTVVTLIKSDNLKGGETIVEKTYTAKPRPKWAKRKGEAMYGKRIIPEVVYMEDGESIIYDHALPHSVSQVTQGTRTVLVTWFTKGDK